MTGYKFSAICNETRSDRDGYKAAPPQHAEQGFFLTVTSQLPNHRPGRDKAVQ